MNPFLPLWEYVPDGEPRVFGNRVYIYGSHDRVASERFCDFKLKVWSAPVSDLSHWICHGDSFHSKADRDHASDADWATDELFAPDVVEKDGKYYLYVYLVNARGCVAVSDVPEGPFRLLAQYSYNISDDEEGFDKGIFVDPGVLVDEDGKVYIYCGFQRSYMAQINPDNMYEILDGSFQKDIIPREGPFSFYEACSIRKVNDTYYLIYSPNQGSRLVYATSSSPEGPFTYQGVIVDNGVDYPGGNNHGSICEIQGQWYIFYHRTTNETSMSRRACAERIKILPNGEIPQVEMTSLGFQEALNPYKPTPADIACVLKGGAYINEKNPFCRVVTSISHGTVIGYKYFDFGDDFTEGSMIFAAKIRGCGCFGKIQIYIDSENGERIGICETGLDDGVVRTVTKQVTGCHALYLVVENAANGWAAESFRYKELFELEEFVFMK